MQNRIKHMHMIDNSNINSNNNAGLQSVPPRNASEQRERRDKSGKKPRMRSYLTM